MQTAYFPSLWTFHNKTKTTTEHEIHHYFQETVGCRDRMRSKYFVSHNMNWQSYATIYKLEMSGTFLCYRGGKSTETLRRMYVSLTAGNEFTQLYNGARI